MTVKELRAKLSRMPGTLRVFAVGPDCGGYDAVAGKDVILIRSGDVVMIAHDDKPEREDWPDEWFNAFLK